MKNTKLALTVIASTLMFSSLAVQAHGNGDDNVQTTKSYQNFIQSQRHSDEVKSDNSVFQNHDSNN